MPFKTKELGDFLGQGITLPLELVGGKPVLKSGFDLIKSSIITILSWDYGRRFFLNEFGSKINQLIEEPNDDILQEVVEVFVIDAISKWEPRVERVSALVNRTDYGMDVSITYRIIALQKEDTFVFPFYKRINY